MLDIEYILQNPEKIEDTVKKKRIPFDIKQFLDLDQKRKKQIHEVEQLREYRNEIAREIPKFTGEKKKENIEKGKSLKITLASLEKELNLLKEEWEKQMLCIPNPPLNKVPFGETDKDNLIIESWGEVPQFDFEPLDHIELARQLDILDFPRAVKISGTKQYFLKKEGALLEWAVLRFAMDYLLKKGYDPFIPPLMVHRKAMFGTGYFPGGEEQTYAIPEDELYLVGTSEVSLCAYHQDQVYSEAELPIRSMALSPCFRREAGTYGKDSQGLYRIHQFQKVEQVIVSTNDPKVSKQMHLELLSNARSLLEALKLPYRVALVCTGDLGLGQVIKHDLETWMPSRNSFNETHSCSSLYEFQARRLNIKYRNKEGKIRFVHTLNNTAVASPRILIPLLELYQQKDGSVLIPKVLWPYTNGLKKIEPKIKSKKKFS